MSYAQHQKEAENQPVACAVITASDTRTVETDAGGAYIQEALRGAGHAVAGYQIIKDEPAQVQEALDRWTGKDEPQAVIFTGGTGIGKRDTTVDIVSRFLEKTLPGFGEIFRYLSYEEIGSGAIMSRAVAGVARNTIVFSIPGSVNAVQLAMNKLILKEISHLVWEVAR